ncbi:DUF2777 family protein [Priestia taiwanensis]|uniref:DUF2777 domain-containing protein n=1 Tax=Priestia taiwanensis TaxID=1347902 RepID=A0A917AV46_9BACI|nr:DUF2777 family protein [Priestia taiwanensis]MBM7364209.1 hypothetical protein [Priestia taiwanensis]GGE72529.1 hypothetical protein GCM10007140_23070 [Priestia taiwanensis]
MNRYQLLQEQPRAYTSGNVEYINNEWVFFDEESDEAYLLADFVSEDLEIHMNEVWIRAYFFEDDVIQIENKQYFLQHGEYIRIRKKLQTSYQEFLHELSDEAFTKLVDALNELDYSIYDCIYCHNFLSFQPKDKSAQGINFFLFDNEDLVCSLHHSFIRDATIVKDRFSFARTDGLMMEIH